MSVYLPETLSLIEVISLCDEFFDVKEELVWCAKKKEDNGRAFGISSVALSKASASACFTCSARLTHTDLLVHLPQATSFSNLLPLHYVRRWSTNTYENAQSFSDGRQVRRGLVIPQLSVNASNPSKGLYISIANDVTYICTRKIPSHLGWLLDLQTDSTRRPHFSSTIGTGSSRDIEQFLISFENT